MKTHHESTARSTVLRQADALADWISAECMGAAQIKDRAVIRDVTSADFTQWPVSWLLALQHDFCQPSATRCAAVDAIAERYLATQQAQAEIARIVAQLEQQEAEDEREDRRELATQFRRVMGYSAAAHGGVL